VSSRVRRETLFHQSSTYSSSFANPEWPKETLCKKKHPLSLACFLHLLPPSILSFYVWSLQALAPTCSIVLYTPGVRWIPLVQAHGS
jgi:hypothetical protein